MIRGRGNIAGLGDMSSSSSSYFTTKTGGPTSGLKSDREFADRQFRTGWIEDQLEDRRADFTDTHNLSVHIGSWNVGGAKKPPEDIAPWILDPETCNNPAAMPDIFAIGFQEIVDLNAGNLLTDNSASRQWEALIERTLAQRYQLIASKTLVGLALCVYVKRSLHQFVTDVQDDKVGVGIMGRVGNKGAVAIRFRVYDSTFCFVNSHLAAHATKVQDRNSDYHNICARVSFRRLASSNSSGGSGSGSGVGNSGSGNTGLDSLSSPTASSSSSSSSSLSIFDHEFVFWLGDLNYRLNLTDFDATYSRVFSQDWQFLLSHDQLIQEKAAGNAFEGWNEGPLTFGPTYKYIPGTHEYDRRPDKKKRLPAWCDRIQWIGANVTQRYYRRAELCLSDHKPVLSLFSVPAHAVVPELRARLIESLHSQLDAWEHARVPRVEVAPRAIHVDDVAFDTPYTRKVTVTNTGAVVAKFSVTSLSASSSAAGAGSGAGAGSTGTGAGAGAGAGGASSGSGGLKDWVTVWPQVDIIPPEHSIELNIEIKVTKKHAFALACGADDFTESLCLRVENGVDVVLPVSGEYRRSCYGLPLTWLCHCPGPARTVLPPRLAAGAAPGQPAVLTLDPATSLTGPGAGAGAGAGTGAGVGGGDTSGLPLPVPAELWRLIDALSEHRLDTEGIFTINGAPREMLQIREALDTGMAFPPDARAHSYAESLVRFLSLLHEPVFPAPLARAYKGLSLPLDVYCQNALQLLPPAHYNTFVYVIAFLRAVLQRSDRNRSDLVKLVVVFSNCLMQPMRHSREAGAGDAGAGAGSPVGGAGGGVNGGAGSGSRQEDEDAEVAVLSYYITTHDFE